MEMEMLYLDRQLQQDIECAYVHFSGKKKHFHHMKFWAKTVSRKIGRRWKENQKTTIAFR